MRKVMHLNYDWKYTTEFRQEYINTTFDDSKFSTVMLPHTNIELPYNNFDETLYQFVNCYRRRITVGNGEIGKNAILHFEAVMTYARVYVNGNYICEHKGGYTPFKCDITKFIKYGEDNILVVMVDSTERKDIPPFGHVIDYLTYGGIYREVWLEFVNDIYVDNIFVKTRNVLSKKKLMDIELSLNNYSGVKQELALEFSLMKDNKKILGFEKNIDISEERRTVFDIVQEADNILLWDNINPNLYFLFVKLKQNNNVIDEYTQRFGFREVAFKFDGFYLNGTKMKLIGLNHHQSFPYVGYAMPKSAQIKDAEILKYELGVNFVRLSHYPQSEHFLDRCDELGLLIFEEIPGWQHIGDIDWQGVAIKNVEEMIKRDRNRPSIVLWGVRINESQDSDEFYSETNKVAKLLDDTRQTGGVRNFEGSHLFEDVYTFNDFVHRGKKLVLQQPRNVAKKEVPYLVTEHNGHMFPTKKFDNEAKRVEQSLRHLRVLDSMYKDPHISGSIGWCMFDYNTHKDFGSGDRICYHGVMDMFRIPKDAASVYSSQQQEKPVLEVLSSMNLGEREAAELALVYVFTNCDYLKLYKNDVYIGTYYPNKKAYSGVPHPPIIINDFIGNLIEKNEGFNKKDAKRIKDIILAIVKYGDKSLPLKYKITMVWLMYKYKMAYEDALSLYTTYISNWSCKSLSYEFEGYKNDKPVLKVKKGSSTSSDLLVIPDKDILLEDETYDVCRVVLKHIDEYGNTLVFSNEVIVLVSEGEGEIIGPKKISLIGGSIAFWVKSIGRSGNIKVSVKSDRFETKTIEFKVDKI